MAFKLKKKWRSFDLGAFRRQHRLSMEMAAEKAGVSAATWCRWERDDRISEAAWRRLMESFPPAKRLPDLVARHTGIRFSGATPTRLVDYGEAFIRLTKLIGRKQAGTALSLWHLANLVENGKSPNDDDRHLVYSLLEWGEERVLRDPVSGKAPEDLKERFEQLWQEIVEYHERTSTKRSS